MSNQATDPDLARLQRAEAHLKSISDDYPDLRHLTDAERKTSIGKLVARDAEPLAQLFAIIGTSRLRTAFDALGATDHGEDPERFEVELLQTKLAAIGRLNILSSLLHSLADEVDDTILSLGEEVVGPGLLALELSKVLSKGNKEFRGQVADVLNRFSSLTVKARQAAAKARETDTETADDETKPTK